LVEKLGINEVGASRYLSTYFLHKYEIKISFNYFMFSLCQAFWLFFWTQRRDDAKTQRYFS